MYTPGTPYVTGTVISSSVANLVNSDFATGLSTAICKDGQTTITANIPMNSKKFTGLAAGSGNGDSVRYEQVGTLASAQISTLSGAVINTKRATVASAATTADIWAAAGNEIDWTGTATCTDFPAAPQAGASRILICAAAAPFTAGANMLIDGTASGSTITLAANDIVTVHAITTTQFRLAIQKYDGIPVANNAQIQPISASVGSSALTISASNLSLSFRSTTLGSGTVTAVTGTPANLVISSGSTLGTTNGVASRIVVLALNNAGTIELAAVNIAGGNDLSETGLISTTAEGGAGAADSANVIYSTTARTNVAYRVIGYIESTQATAGTWAAAPSTIQGAGGNAIASMSSIGYGQTWQNVTGSRALGTTYYNTTGKPISVMANCTTSGASSYFEFHVNGANIQTVQSAAGTQISVTSLVPPGCSYSIVNGSGCTLALWSELR